jgi:poly(3-hydroxybutyrate) depolymerase
MAAVLAATYPDLFAAVGIHSGLPHGAAHDLVTALGAMRHGPLQRDRDAARPDRQPVPTIVFHGEEDTTVHPDNGDEVIAQARWDREAQDDPDSNTGMSVERGSVPGGRAYRRTVHRDADGRCDAEHWLIHGSGHAWSGGSAIGSYTDPLGPDASVHMLRFFIEHPKRP